MVERRTGYKSVFKKGDVVYNPKKGYVAVVTLAVDNEVGDLFLKVITEAPEGEYFSNATNSSKVIPDEIGELLYG